VPNIQLNVVSWLADIVEVRKGFDFLSCIEGKGSVKEIHYSACTKYRAIRVDLLYIV
jgi:hypothetical protein